MQCNNLAILKPKLISTEMFQYLVTPTLHGQLNGGIAHPHHILGNAGQQETVVITAHVDKGQVYGVDRRTIVLLGGRHSIAFRVRYHNENQNNIIWLPLYIHIVPLCLTHLVGVDGVKVIDHPVHVRVGHP